MSQEILEKPGMKRSSFSCITKFGIKMTAEDCNLEILRLSYTIPSTSATTQSHQQLLETTSLIYDHDLDKGIKLATPIDLSVSTPLRFEIEMEHTSAKSEEKEIEKNWEDEPSSLQQVYHVVNNYLNTNKNSSKPSSDSITQDLDNKNLTFNETSDISQ